MKHIILALTFMHLFVTFSVLSQTQNEDQLSKALENYQSKLEQFINLEDCGHMLDGPAYFYKQFENSALDLLLDITPTEEEEIGKKSFERISKKEKILESHWAYEKINQLIQNLVKGLNDNNLKFSVYIIESESINAFTTMGKRIYVNTGLIDFVDSFDELAFILGHEIAHSIHHHTDRKIKKLMIASGIDGLIDLKDFENYAVNIGLALSAPFDQIDEYESDKLGATLAKKAGYDVTKFDDFFDKLIKYQRKNIFIKLTSTHPYPEHRKNCISEFTAQ